MIYTLCGSSDFPEMRAPNPNERVILNTADSDAELSNIKGDIHKHILSSTLEEVKNLHDITPHKCRETKALHRGNICLQNLLL